MMPAVRSRTYSIEMMLVVAAIAAMALAAILLGSLPASARALELPPTPIPSTGAQPTFEGAPANPAPIPRIGHTPQNPYMAFNGTSEIHDDAWQTDAYTWAGPLGRAAVTKSTLITRDCGSLTFDEHGHVLSVCVGLSGPQLYMFDPDTLATIATFALPPRQSAPAPTTVYQDFTGGGYFYLDDQGDVVTATTTRHIFVIAETSDGTGFVKVGDYDLSGVLSPDEKITSALPDVHGLLWFVARSDGVVGTLDFKSGQIHVVRLGHGADGEIENSFATDMKGGVYLATNHALYRFVAGTGGVPRISWQVRYPNSGETKPGQVDAGTGTTPTVMQHGYVSITDDADPMNVVVYRTKVKLTKRVRRHHHWRRIHQRRQVCKVPVFSRGAGDTENSIVAAGRSMIVENNYGYSGLTSVENGGMTKPGFARVDINKNGKGCRLVWANTTEAAPSVVPKLSLATGLLYTYTKGPGSSDPWYWTTLSYRTGKVVYKQLAGTGLGYNNNYAGIALSRNGTEYLGTLGGLIMLRDGI